MLRKIIASFFFFAFFVILSVLCLWTAANIVVSSRLTKMFVTGNLSRIINPSCGDVNISNIKLSHSRPPSIIFSDIKIYGKTMPPPGRKSSGSGAVIESRPIVFSCDKVIILPDYQSFIKGKSGVKKITITGGNLNLPSSKLTLKNLNLVFSDITGKILHVVFNKPQSGENTLYGIRVAGEETPLAALKSDFTLLYNNKHLCDVLIEDGVIDFSSQELRLNKLSVTPRPADAKIQEIKGVVKFFPPEGLSYHLAFECSAEELKRFLSDKYEVVKILDIGFKRSQTDREEKFYVVISNKNINKSPTEISITPKNSGMKIQISL